MNGRGKEAAHTSVPGAPHAVPILSWDYCYLSSIYDKSSSTGSTTPPTPSSNEPESPVLVMWDSKSKGLYAHILPAKGVDYEGLEIALKLVAADLDRLGYKRVAFRNDTEPAIVAFLREFRKYWTGEVVPEKAAVGDPQSNGAAEAAVSILKGRVRTLKDVLEHNLSATTGLTTAVSTAAEANRVEEAVTIPPTSGLMTLIVKQAAATQRLFSVGPDGRTPHERSTGRQHRPAVAEFGEAVWWMPLQTSNNRLPPLGARFEDGFYMGTNEVHPAP